MSDILAAVILLLLLIAIWIWAVREASEIRTDGAVGLAVFSAVASSLIIGTTILGLLGLIDDPYCLRCS